MPATAPVSFISDPLFPCPKGLTEEQLPDETIGFCQARWSELWVRLRYFPRHISSGTKAILICKNIKPWINDKTINFVYHSPELIRRIYRLAGLEF